MPISQREARRLRKRVEELEWNERERRSLWTKEYPGGVNLLTWSNPSVELSEIVRVSQALGHAVVLKRDNSSGHILLYAIKHAEDK